MSAHLTRPTEVRALLNQLGLRPSKALGQNFLIDQNILEIMLGLAELHEDDEVLEVGPGLGVLTEVLLPRVRRVLAIEKDRRLHAYLNERFQDTSVLELVRADILDQDLESLMGSGINKLVANLPYSVGTRLLVDVVELMSPPTSMVVTLQLDVGQRLAAEPRTKAYGAISVLAQTRYQVKLEKVVTPTCFYPVPDVRSAIVRMRRLDPMPDTPSDRAHLRRLLKHAFHHRRKQLRVIMRSAPSWVSRTEDHDALFENLGIDPRTRPDALSVAAWCGLSDALARDTAES